MPAARAAIVVIPLLLSACNADPTEPPVQPVRFSHLQHAGNSEIGCPVCHSYAEHSSVAGIPSMGQCNGCHKLISSDKPEIQRVNQAFAKGTAIEWTRVYRLPDHVFFTHDRHIASHVACAACHGDVAHMDVVRLAQPLTMGFCLGCHNGEQAPRDCLTCHK